VHRKVCWRYQRGATSHSELSRNSSMS